MQSRQVLDLTTCQH